jgi:hypothetical protein
MIKVRILNNWAIYLETDWQWLIKLSWGKRRVSSRANSSAKAYPESVGATLGVWASWYLKNRKYKFDSVIISTDPEDHGASYVAKLEKERADSEAAAARSSIESRLTELQARRAIARAAKDWATADAIRDEIEAVGISVRDEKST